MRGRGVVVRSGRIGGEEGRLIVVAAAAVVAVVGAMEEGATSGLLVVSMG